MRIEVRFEHMNVAEDVVKATVGEKVYVPILGATAGVVADAWVDANDVVGMKIDVEDETLQALFYSSLQGLFTTPSISLAQTADCFRHGEYEVAANGVGFCPKCTEERRASG